MQLRDTVDILVSKDPVVSREAVPAKIYGALAVHKDIVQGKRQLWKISHIRSGLSIGGEMTLKAAVGMAKDLADLPEWQHPCVGSDPASRNAANRPILDRLFLAVREARAFHTGGGTRA
jgi:hypothetical protein